MIASNDVIAKPLSSGEEYAASDTDGQESESSQQLPIGQFTIDMSSPQYPWIDAEQQEGGQA
jgi:hypothetical protein